MKRIFRQNQVVIIIAAGLFALLLAAAVMAIYQITPFGDRNLLFSDDGAQYATFLTAFRHALLTHQFSSYSFSLGLGSNAMPTIAYYLMSPFNLLLIFFSAAQVPSAITLIIILKIGCIAAAMAYFLQRHFQTISWWSVLFGAAFGLCGFVAADYFDIMWLDSLICLPLIIDGLDTVITGGRPTKLFIWLLISIIVNYYLGYMTCIFIVCYTIYGIYERGNGRLPFHKLVGRNWHAILIIMITGLCSVLGSMMILLPTVFGMMQTAKHRYLPTNFTFKSMFSFPVLTQLGIGGVNFNNHLIHAPAIFSTLVVTLLALGYFVHPHISRPAKYHAAVFLLGLLLSMKICATNTIWHLFQQPSGFPFRQAFFFSFILIMLGYGTWLKNAKLIPHLWQLTLPILLAIGLILGTLEPNLLSATGFNNLNRYQLGTLAINLILVLVAAIALFLTQHTLQIGLMISLFAIELGGNFGLTLAGSPFGNQTRYQTLYQKQANRLQPVTKQSNQLYRTDNQSQLINSAYEKYYNYNDSLLFQYHGIPEYNSTINDTTRRTLNSLGMFSRNVRRISAQGLMPVTEMLLGIKYRVNRDNQLTSNSNNVGMGFPVASSFLKINLHPTKKFTNLEQILKSLNQTLAPYFYPATISHIRNVQRHSASYRHTLKMTVGATGPLYLNARIRGTNYATLTVNGRQISVPQIPANGYRYLAHLGTFKKGTKLSIGLTTTHPYRSGQLQFESLNQHKFSQIVKFLKFPGFVPKIVGNQISGDVVANHHEKWAYLAIPFDKGWQVKVSGQPVATRKVLGGLTAVPIKPGVNYLVLNYRTPGLLVGLLLSICGVGFFWITDLVSGKAGRPKHAKKFR